MMASEEAPTAVESAIAHAFETSDREDAARRAKNVIAAELQRFDRRLRVRSTSYFTHNYIPDLIVEWRDAGVVNNRQVFLRFHLDTPDVAADMSAAANDSPMFVALRRTPHPLRRDLSDKAPSTLITQATALEKIAKPDVTSQSLGRMVAGSLIRGGKGVLLDEEAETVSAAASHSLESLHEGDVQSTAQAIDTFGQYLAEDHTLRLNRFMQLMWRAHGHELQTFPSSDVLSGHLSDSEARELLTELFASPSLEDLAFWRRLGGLLDLEQLETFVDIPHNANFNNLVSANLDRFRALVLAVENRDPEILDRDLPRWSVRDRSLALEGDGFRVLLASDRRRFGQVRSTHRLPSWSDLNPRLESYRVQQLSLIGPTTQVEVKVDEARNLLMDADIIGLSSAVHEEMQVRRATLIDWNGPLYVEADFGKWILDAGDQGAPIGKLAEAGVNVLWAPDAELRAVMSEFLAQPDNDTPSVDVPASPNNIDPEDVQESHISDQDTLF
ncbi:hypothetical protein ACGFNP_60050 [Nonomuraea sp. NPDC049269]|uniref:hypothetical protein n=1 Tax=Nonomuraea sp. NPDC049269 TaxID=3364349 RepID=UPI00372196D6